MSTKKRGAPQKPADQLRRPHTITVTDPIWVQLQERSADYGFGSVSEYLEYVAGAFVPLPPTRPALKSWELCSKCGERKRDGRMSDRTLCRVCGKK